MAQNVRRCVVKDCISSAEETVDIHLFPLDQFPDRDELAENWTPILFQNKIDETDIRRFISICSKHFTSDCFIKNNNQVKLKTDAVPSIFSTKKSLQKKSSPIKTNNTSSSSTKKETYNVSEKNGANNNNSTKCNKNKTIIPKIKGVTVSLSKTNNKTAGSTKEPNDVAGNNNITNTNINNMNTSRKDDYDFDFNLTTLFGGHQEKKTPEHIFSKRLRNSTTPLNSDNSIKNNTITTSKSNSNLKLSKEIPPTTLFENKTIYIELTNDKDVNSKFSLTFTPSKEDNSSDCQTIKVKGIKNSGTKSFTQELELVNVAKDITIRKFIEDYQILKIFEIKLLKLNDGTNIVVHDKSSSDINKLQNISNEKSKKIDQLKQRLLKLESKCKELDLQKINSLVFVKLFKAREILKNSKEKLLINEKQMEKIKYCDCEKDPLNFLNFEKYININNINTLLEDNTTLAKISSNKNNSDSDVELVDPEKLTKLVKESSNKSDSDSDIEIVEQEECKINLYKNAQNKTELELAKHKYIILRELCKFNTDKYSNSEQILAHMNKARKTLFNLTKFRIDPLPFSVPAVEAFSNICKESYRICKELTDFERGEYPKKIKDMERLIEFVRNFERVCSLSDDFTNELAANKEKLSIKFNDDSKDLNNYQLIDTKFPIYNQTNDVNLVSDNSNQLKNTDETNPANLETDVEFVKVEEFRDDIENDYLLENNLKDKVPLQEPITTLKEKSTNNADVNKKEIKVDESFKSLDIELDDDTEPENTESENIESVNTEPVYTEPVNTEPVNNLISDFKFYSYSSSSSESEFEEFQFPKKQPVYIRISKNEFKCIKCDKITPSANGIIAHYNVHLTFSTLCHTCGRIFETKAKLYTHYNYCSKELYKNGVKIERRAMKKKTRRYPKFKTCPYKNCASILHDDYRYYEHQNFHTGEEPYKCSCGKTFSKSFFFYAHFNRPSNKNEKNCTMDNCILPPYAPTGNFTILGKFQCGFKDCCKSFDTKFKLLEHAYAHTGEKLYYCSCGLNYRYFINFTSHINDSKCSPIGCIYPDYVDPQSLIRKGIRGKRKIIKEIDFDENSPCPSPSNIQNETVKRPRTLDSYCSICNIKFPSYEKYHHHKTKHAERKYPCQECKRSYQTLAMLNEHKKIHMIRWICKICNKLFYKRSLYKIHIEGHKNKENDSKTEIKRTTKVLIDTYDCKICSNQLKCSKEFIEHFRDKKHEAKEFYWRKKNKITKISCHLCSDVTFANLHEACSHYRDFHRLLRNVFKYIYKESRIKDETTCINKSYITRGRNKTKKNNDDATLSQFHSKDCITSPENKEKSNEKYLISKKYLLFENCDIDEV